MVNDQVVDLPYAWQRGVIVPSLVFATPLDIDTPIMNVVNGGVYKCVLRKVGIEELERIIVHLKAHHRDYTLDNNTFDIKPSSKQTRDSITTIKKSDLVKLLHGGSYDMYRENDGSFCQSHTDCTLTRDIQGSSVLTKGSVWGLICINYRHNKMCATRGLGSEEYEYSIVE